MKLKTADAKKMIGKKVKIKKNGLYSEFSIYIVKAVYKKNFILDSDTLHFDQILEIEVLT